MPEEVCVLGDSVILGVVYDEDRGRYSVLRDGAVTSLTRGLGMRVHNLARMGQTSVEARARLEDAIREGLKADSLLIELGGNDCDFNWAEVGADPDSDHSPRIPVPVFKDAMADIVRMAASNGMAPIFFTLPPLAPDKFFDWVTKDGISKENVMRFLGDLSRIYRWQELYSLAVMKLASEIGAPLIDIRERFLMQKNYEDAICLDGIHPNAGGHTLMKKTISDFFGIRSARLGLPALA
ncbi:MAG TPA: SGNH/GDSL hydrolase family protein [Bacillota bacterium]|nr:SGNH/GDSL hydrolase family protein [Bacillota bacterium]HOH09693.1 SGNH/GDSL hydrolase family protein [Bacillota bacterium]HOS49809.1 SGNH/GDSL hydrolase family protein [Bacillota bacterium]HOY89040.1 SGNH/GDSL hydrolase family protein [Bacillota bacterium]HPI00580.1 SGNH/GDSL hydrolase family protein [Bacillota bacterium]